MKLKNPKAGDPAIVLGRPVTVDCLQLNAVCFTYDDDGRHDACSYNLLEMRPGSETKTTNSNMKIAILDIETTDFLARGGKIVEIGIVELCLQTGERRIVFDEVCHEKGITREECEKSWIVANSDLTVEQIRTSRSLDAIRPEVQAVLDRYPMGCTAFNNTFDFGFLDDRGFRFPKKLACPMKLSTNICKIPKRGGYGYKWPNVEEAHRHFFGEVGYVEKHRGADDAYHEAAIVYKLYELGIFTLN